MSIDLQTDDWWNFIFLLEKNHNTYSGSGARGNQEELVIIPEADLSVMFSLKSQFVQFSPETRMYSKGRNSIKQPEMNGKELLCFSPEK